LIIGLCFNDSSRRRKGAAACAYPPISLPRQLCFGWLRYASQPQHARSLPPNRISPSNSPAFVGSRARPPEHQRIAGAGGRAGELGRRRRYPLLEPRRRAASRGSGLERYRCLGRYDRPPTPAAFRGHVSCIAAHLVGFLMLWTGAFCCRRVPRCPTRDAGISSALSSGHCTGNVFCQGSVSHGANQHPMA